MKVKLLERQAEEATKRYVKVKALLQRQHQANQQNVEEKNMMKISQREALQELKTLKQREDHEKEALLETLRIQKIEAAFHNDLELLIQQKADELYSQQQILREKEKDLIEKKQTMMMMVDTKSDEKTDSDSIALNELRQAEKELKERVMLLEARLEATEKDYSAVHSAKEAVEASLTSTQGALKDSEKERKQLLRRLDDEERLREELEAELKMTLSNQSTMLEDMTKYTEVLVSKRCEELTLENKTIRKQLDATVRELDATKNDSQGVSIDVSALRLANEELLRQCREVPRLEALIAELKNSQLLMQRSKQHDSELLTSSFMELIEVGLAISSMCETYMVQVTSAKEVANEQSRQTKKLASGVVSTLLTIIGEGADNVFAAKLRKVEQQIALLQADIEGSREDDDLIIATQKFTSLLKQQANLKIIADHFNDLQGQLQQPDIVEYLRSDGGQSIDTTNVDGGADGGMSDSINDAKLQIARFQEISSKFKSKLFHDAPSFNRKDSSLMTSSHGLTMNTSGTIATYSGESIVIKPGDEFRIRIPPVTERPFMLSYQFCLPKDRQRRVDIGFAIVTEKADGSLPQMSRYRRVPAQGESRQMVVSPDPSGKHPSETIAFVFDNTYSWTRPKEVRYEIKIESLVPSDMTSSSSGQEHSIEKTRGQQSDEMIARKIIQSIQSSIGFCTQAILTNVVDK